MIPVEGAKGKCSVASMGVVDFEERGETATWLLPEELDSFPSFWGAPGQAVALTKRGWRDKMQRLAQHLLIPLIDERHSWQSNHPGKPGSRLRTVCGSLRARGNFVLAPTL